MIIALIDIVIDSSRNNGNILLKVLVGKLHRRWEQYYPTKS